MTIRIHQLGGVSAGRTLSFEGGPITVGRRQGSSVTFDAAKDLSVSTDHAEVVLKDGVWIYCDRGSSNGSWMGQERIDDRVIIGGEEISLGSQGPVLRFEITGVERRAEGGAGIGQERAPGPSVGSKTVAMMIQSALVQSKQTSGGRVGTTSFIRAVAVEAARHGSRRFKVAAGTVIVLLGAGLAFALVELGRTREQVHELSEMQKSAAEDVGSRIADRNGRAIHLLVYRTSMGHEQGFCTGFAIGSSRLLTNAHCVARIEQLAAEGSSFFAAPNGGGGERYPVKQWSKHPRYNPKSSWPTPDIGVITVDGGLEQVVALAPQEILGRIGAGAAIFVYGFPGDLSDVGSPVATLTEGIVGRVTGLDGRPVQGNGNQLLQYSAFTTQGTSGSPVFDREGRVVAINSGYYQGRSMVTIENTETGKSSRANVSRDLSGYSFGIRIDLAQDLIGAAGTAKGSPMGPAGT